MHFSTATVISLLATSAVASPIFNIDLKKWGSIWDWKKDFENKWDHESYNKHSVFEFDKVFVVKADGDHIINTDGKPVPGQKGAKGLFKYGIIEHDNTICYSITLSGVTGEYQSAALTATHIHEAPKGKSGPPRLAFPNPKGPDERRVSYGCMTGPFKTGIIGHDGKDTGEDFHVKEIIKNPRGFFTDTHTKKYVAGAVRGQLH